MLIKKDPPPFTTHKISSKKMGLTEALLLLLCACWTLNPATATTATTSATASTATTATPAATATPSATPAQLIDMGWRPQRNDTNQVRDLTVTVGFLVWIAVASVPFLLYTARQWRDARRAADPTNNSRIRNDSWMPNESLMLEPRLWGSVAHATADDDATSPPNAEEGLVCGKKAAGGGDAAAGDAPSSSHVDVVWDGEGRLTLQTIERKATTFPSYLLKPPISAPSTHERRVEPLQPLPPREAAPAAAAPLAAGVGQLQPPFDDQSKMSASGLPEDEEAAAATYDDDDDVSYTLSDCSDDFLHRECTEEQVTADLQLATS